MHEMYQNVYKAPKESKYRSQRLKSDFRLLPKKYQNSRKCVYQKFVYVHSNKDGKQPVNLRKLMKMYPNDQK